MNTHDLAKYAGFPMCYTVKEKEVTLSSHTPVEVGDVCFNPPLSAFPKDVGFYVTDIKESRPARGVFRNARPTFYRLVGKWKKAEPIKPE